MYGIEPIQLIEVKGLQGDTSDNIPGVPGVGEKTALTMVQTYGSIEKIYQELEEGKAETIKGKTREKMLENKELAFLSKTLGTINLEVPIEETIESLKIKEWDKQKVYEDFKKLRFHRYMERFGLTKETEQVEQKENWKENFEIKEIEENGVTLKAILKEIKEKEEFIYFLGKEEVKETDSIIKKKITSISIVINHMVYYSDIGDIQNWKEIFENNEIKKIGYHLQEDYVILKEHGITM